MLGTLPRRRLLLALGIWAACTIVYFGAVPRERLMQHTQYNHFALLAESMLHGRLDLPGGPPPSAGNNDFATYGGKTWVVFPAFPAVLMLPLVALSGSAERFRDGVFFLFLAGLGPALFFLALERLADARLSLRSERENAGLAGVLGLGSVYFFTAVQGTVWFGAHVVAVALASLYLLASVEARSPVLAGLALGLGFFTRTPLVYAFPFFVYEALRVSRGAATAEAAGERAWNLPDRGELATALRSRFLPFAVPVALVALVMLGLNRARFGDPLDFGYRHLTIAWKPRIDRWGLFSFHYLSRNLAVALTSLPFPAPKASAGPPLQISAHGLALWLTTPVYLALVRSQAGLSRGAFQALLATALCVALPSLFYQNTGQLQFGFRFSNDFVVFLLAALAISSFRLSRPFWALAAIGVAVNTFGAITFDNPRYERFYLQNGGGPIHPPD